MEGRSPNRFTLRELVVVVALITIAAGLVFALNGMVDGPGHSRPQSEIRAMSAACEAFKADNGNYPQSSTATDTLDPTSTSAAIHDPANYKAASLFLWQQLSGHLHDTNPTAPPTDTNYAGGIFKDSMLGGTKTGKLITAVICIQDPFGNSFGYGTAGLAAQQAYKAAPKGATIVQPAGYNPTFDLWSTAGTTRQTGVSGSASDVKNKWIKNW